MAQCKACDAGKVVATTGSTAESDCTPCNAGYVSASGAATCTPCAAGTRANAGTCTNCLAGTFSNATSSACTDCAMGKYVEESLYYSVYQLVFERNMYTDTLK